ncbi:septal ring lytic transglycosylase RlpA family protein [Hyphomicrobium sp. LHD-15]|uniref:septal ring lytic transglycosylase RlpA family protein n=1 Tax=Hyphomicrobium sp. LHD-15 TaxID=3072142 RepID=UPI00280EDE34|nr:septal ring lytic transglycosylase RlpA family protein [Hyphomicrobium sp. LHD-15]MDQ8697209.1 septal ring lytic transglycosylase RlpA family protein [Hyphomicrobium sp. LHD-15]
MPREKRPLRLAASYSGTGWRLALPALAGAGAILIAGLAASTVADAKSPGSRYCFNGYCHRVGTLAQTDTLVGWRGYLLASYYDSCKLDRLNPCGLTSSGAVFRPDLPDNAASPLLPDGTVILAYNPKTGDASVLRVTNAGPYSGKRKLDVSRAAAEKLGFSKQGVAPLVISVLQSPTKSEASYVRRREYAKVPGYLGRFETVDMALAMAEQRLDVRQDSDTLETSALGETMVPRPQLAVSPSLARELVILRSAPRPADRGVRLVQGPQLVTRDSFKAQQQTSQPADVRMDFASGLQRYLFATSEPDAGRAPGAPDGGN